VAEPTKAIPATPATRLTIDELARRTGCTTRNIRNYQTLGLLPGPTLEGRVGYYDDGHVGRLRLIGRLQEQGFSLGAIRELLQAWEEGRSLGDLLGFEQALTAPWSDEEPQHLTIPELMALFPGHAHDLAGGLRSLELGLIELEPDGRVRVPSPTLLNAGAELVAVGVPMTAAQDEFARLRDDVERIATRFVQLFEDHVWRPYVEAGMPRDRLPAVTDALRRMRPLASATVQALLARAMERRSSQSITVQAKLAAELESAGQGGSAEGSPQ
jgi:DNA-binding transcriptional MerR regulator